MFKVVEIDDCSEAGRFFKFLSWCVVGTEHNIFIAQANFFCQGQFGKRAAINAKALLGEYFNYERVGSGFDSKIFLEVAVPLESLFERARLRENSFFVIDMEWCRVLFGDRFKVFFR